MFKRISIIIFFYILTGCTKVQKTVVQSVNQEEANKILLILANNNINADKKKDEKDEFFSILVEPKNEILALNVLSNYGEPAKTHDSLGQIFKKEGMISSPMEEFARYTYALDQEIESTLSQIDGIISVKVQVSLPMPSENLWSSEAAKPGAAIFIKYRPGYRIDLLTNRIKLLVSKAVPGLTTDMVEVMPYQKKDTKGN
jgi:type III secretion protein J